MKAYTIEEWAVFRRRFVAVCLLIIIGGSCVTIATYGSFWRFFYNARMTNFSVCLGLDSKGHPIPIVRPLTTTVNEINVCGYLEGYGPTIPLVFYFQQISQVGFCKRGGEASRTKVKNEID
jgi:hypothetical protein